MSAFTVAYFTKVQVPYAEWAYKDLLGLRVSTTYFCGAYWRVLRPFEKLRRTEPPTAEPSQPKYMIYTSVTSLYVRLSNIILYLLLSSIKSLL